MSYSFSFTEDTKFDAKTRVANELDKVVEFQHCHAADAAQALATALAFIDILPEDPTKVISFGMSGSLSGQWKGLELEKVTGASLTISVAHIPKAV